MSLVSGLGLVAILSASSVLLLWAAFGSHLRSAWRMSLLALIVPFIVSYCLYFYPVWFENGSSGEYWMWAPLVLFPWYLAGLASSAIAALCLILQDRRSREGAE